MKKIIITSLLIISAFTLSAQTAVKKDAQGNYTAVTKQAEIKDTGKTFTDKNGEVYKVYESAKGLLYINRKSLKTGKEYRQYLKEN